jgi:copper(I)-binding protein
MQSSYPLFAATLVAAVFALCGASSTNAQAQHRHGATPDTVKAGSLTVEAPWSRATPGGAKVAGGYLKITNNGAESDRLTGGSLPRAGRVEIHEMAVADGVMRMRPLPAGLEIKPGATVELKPGGLHMMFLDLSAGLKEGETIKGTLVFEKAGTVEVSFRVAPAGSQGAGAASSSHRH